MVRDDTSVAADDGISRRAALTAAGVCLAMLSQRARAAETPGAPAAGLAPTPRPGFAKDSEAHGVVEVKGIHHGKGTGKIKFFSFDGASVPTYFLIYELPPGASEGTHVHFLDNRNHEGSFDEYYYILSGHGQMEVDRRIVPVTAGDHVHTPLEVAHGIENTHPTEALRVFLTFIRRGSEKPPAAKG